MANASLSNSVESVRYQFAFIPARYQLSCARANAYEYWQDFAISSFTAGPSGQRPDFYKQLMGNGDNPAVPLLLCLCNLLAAGRAPAELRAFIRRAKGTALYKKAKDRSDDARPVCSGEAIRRIIGKALLATKIENLSTLLLPHQLAVGVPAGVKAMAHVTRQWRDDNLNMPRCWSTTTRVTQRGGPAHVYSAHKGGRPLAVQVAQI